MTKQASAEVNRLYWETDTSVADIAERLDLSRRALYDALEPIPAGKTCPVCGTMLQYANRSARDSEQGTCFTCATGSPQEQIPVESEAWTWSPGVRSADPAAVASDTALTARARRLGRAALLGAVIGAAVTHLLVRRD
jgi:hypothetical protein